MIHRRQLNFSFIIDLTTTKVNWGRIRCKLQVISGSFSYNNYVNSTSLLCIVKTPVVRMSAQMKKAW